MSRRGAATPATTFAALGLALVAASVIAGCRSRPLTWEEAAPPSDYDADVDATPEHLAKLARSSYDCVEAARKRTAERDEPAGAALLEACLERDDFVDLGVYVEKPFAKAMRRLDRDGRHLAAITARRGGNLDGDFTYLDEHGLEVITLADALYTGIKKGDVVVFRGRYLGPAGPKNLDLVGETTLARPKASSRLWVADPKRKAPKSVLTGNRVLLERKKKGARLRVGEERVFAVRASYVTKAYNDEEGEDQDHLRAKELRSFPVRIVGF